MNSSDLTDKQIDYIKHFNNLFIYNTYNNSNLSNNIPNIKLLYDSFIVKNKCFEYKKNNINFEKIEDIIYNSFITKCKFIINELCDIIINKTCNLFKFNYNKTCSLSDIDNNLSQLLINNTLIFDNNNNNNNNINLIKIQEVIDLIIENYNTIHLVLCIILDIKCIFELYCRLLNMHNYKITNNSTYIITLEDNYIMKLNFLLYNYININFFFLFNLDISNKYNYNTDIYYTQYNNKLKDVNFKYANLFDLTKDNSSFILTSKYLILNFDISELYLKNLTVILCNFFNITTYIIFSVLNNLHCINSKYFIETINIYAEFIFELNRSNNIIINDYSDIYNIIKRSKITEFVDCLNINSNFTIINFVGINTTKFNSIVKELVMSSIINYFSDNLINIIVNSKSLTNAVIFKIIKQIVLSNYYIQNIEYLNSNNKEDLNYIPISYSQIVNYILTDSLNIAFIKDQLYANVLNCNFSTTYILDLYIKFTILFSYIDINNSLFEYIIKMFKSYLTSRKDIIKSIVYIVTSECNYNINCLSLIQYNNVRNNNNEINYVLNDFIAKTNELFQTNYCNEIKNNNNHNYNKLSSTLNNQSFNHIKVELNDSIFKEIINYNNNNSFKHLTFNLINIFNSPNIFLNEYKKIVITNYLIHFNTTKIEKDINILDSLKNYFSKDLLSEVYSVYEDIKYSLKISPLIKTCIEKFNTDNCLETLNCLIILKQNWNITTNNYYNVEDNNNKNSNIWCFEENSKNSFPYYNINKYFTNFVKRFKQLNNNKYLKFYNSIGSCFIDLEFKNGKFKFIVSLITGFIMKILEKHYIKNIVDNNDINEKNPITISEIENESNIPTSKIISSLSFLEDKGVISCYNSNNYCVSNNSYNDKYIVNSYLKNASINNNNNNSNDNCCNTITIIESINYDFEIEDCFQNYEYLICKLLKSSKNKKTIEYIVNYLNYFHQSKLSYNKVNDILGKLILENKVTREGDLYTSI